MKRRNQSNLSHGAILPYTLRQWAGIHLLAMCLSVFVCSGCGYTLKQALRDAKTGQDTERQRALEYLSSYVAQHTNTRKEAEARRQAIQALGHLSESKSINTLRMVLMHESDSVLRRESIRSLGRLQARDALQEVREALRTDQDLDVRMTAAATLGRLGDEGAQRDLILALKDPQPAVRTAAVRALTALRAGVAIPRMVDALMDQNIDVRMVASNALVEIKTQAIPYLIKELSFYEATRRRRVAAVLGRMGREVWGPLLQAFAEKNSREGAKEALIAASGDTATWDPLATILDQTTPTPEENTVKQLGESGSLVTIQAVFVLWQRLSVGHRLQFRSALGKIAMKLGPEARTMLEQYAKQGDDLSARSTAIFALGHSGSEAVPVLQQFLSDTQSAILFSTLLALGRTGEAGLEVLQPYFRSQNEEIRLHAVRALQHLKSTKAVDILIQTLKDQAATLRLAALQGLARQGDKRAIPEIRNLLNDPLNDVILTAIQTLLQLGDEKNLKLYIAAIKHSPFPPAPHYVKTLGDLGDPLGIPLLQRLVRQYMTHWKDHQRQVNRLYRTYRRTRRSASEELILNAVQQKLKEHLANQTNAVCCLIESVRALIRLNQPVFLTLEKAGYRSGTRLNPLQAPPKQCPWPSLNK